MSFRVSLRRLALALGGALVLAGCSGSQEDAGEESGEELYGDDAMIADETYGEYDERRDNLDAGEYEGDGCTVDCSGHDAGYEWAADHGIEFEDDCGGKSWSFNEGCRAYAREYAGEGESSEAYEEY